MDAVHRVVAEGEALARGFTLTGCMGTLPVIALRNV